MKTLSIFFLVVSSSIPSFAADMVRIKAMFIEAADDAVITKAECESETIRKRQGVTILSSPSAITRSGNPSRVSVGEQKQEPSADDRAVGSMLPGISLRALPRVHGDTIKFTATATVRAKEHEESTADGKTTEFMTREHHFSGSVKSGESMLIRLKGVHNGRRLTLYLSFTKESEQ